MEIIFSGGVYVGENTARLANVQKGHACGVPFVRCSEPLPHSNESPVKRVSFESLSKILF